MNAVFQTCPVRHMTSPRPHQPTRLLRYLCFAGLLFWGTSCGDEVPLSDTVNAHLQVFSNDDQAITRFIEQINSETSRIDAAFSAIDHEEVINALIEAKRRGVRVRIVADVDNQLDPGITKLLNEKISFSFIDGELTYLPDPNMSPILKPKGYLVRSSDLSIMTHNFALLGATQVWNFSGPLLQSFPPTLGYYAKSELLREDFTREFNQLFSGVGSTTLDVYNGPVKSSVYRHPYEYDNGEPFYYSDSLYTDNGRLRILFNPQNRAVKTLIDEVYRAKGSIYIQTESIEEKALIKALAYKFDNGFDVRIVVNTKSQSTSYKSDIQKIGAAGIDVPHLPTVIIFDEGKGVGDQFLYPRQAMVISHPIFSTSPLVVVPGFPDDSVSQMKSDTFADGHAWILSEVAGQRGQSTSINQLLDKFNEHWSNRKSLL